MLAICLGFIVLTVVCRDDIKPNGSLYIGRVKAYS